MAALGDVGRLLRANVIQYFDPSVDPYTDLATRGDSITCRFIEVAETKIINGPSFPFCDESIGCMIRVTPVSQPCRAMLTLENGEIVDMAQTDENGYITFYDYKDSSDIGKLQISVLDEDLAEVWEVEIVSRVPTITKLVTALRTRTSSFGWTPG